ncbi:RDD family protein [Undibacterium danionis]|uniref:RDD family protein n=1 Tax=Undibacterium danionis TaxID=1812100 RepID=A0ABV6II63_9BURK
MLNGRLSLITPEGVRLLLTPAGPAPRAWAWAIDFIVYLIALFLLSLLFSQFKLGTGIILIASFLLYWGYAILCEVYWDGRTLGKRVLGIQVLRVDGLPVGWRESVLRNLLLVGDFLPFFYFTGLLCMLFDTQFRRLGDIVAGTQVVYRDPVVARPAPQTAVEESADNLALPYPLTPDQQRTLIAMFEREKSIPHARMLELASLAQAITGQTGEASLARLRAHVAGIKR